MLVVIFSYNSRCIDVDINFDNQVDDYCFCVLVFIFFNIDSVLVDM